MDEDIKRLARFSYEMLQLKLSSLFDFESPVFEELHCDIKNAIIETLTEVVKLRESKISRAFEAQSADIGRVLYHKFLKIRKRHTGIVLYNSIPPNLKDDYRKLAVEIRNTTWENEE